MKPHSDLNVLRVFDRWRKEDRDLESCLDELRTRMRQWSEQGIPQFGETASHLQSIRERLLLHFRSEEEMIDELAKHYSECSPEIAAIRRQTSNDHRLLLSRLDDLVQRLNEPQPRYESWQDAMDDLELFVDTLEQHEEQESESVLMLTPIWNDDPIV